MCGAGRLISHRTGATDRGSPARQTERRMSARRPAAVLWDLDGTLVDTEPYWIECEYELVEEHGGTWNDEHAHAIVGSDLRESARYIREHGSVDLPIDEIVNQLLDGVIARVRRKVPWRPGARDLLAQLRTEKIPCALVTMSWRRLADAVVGELPRGSFAATIVGDEVRRGKPHPEPYLAAARALSVSPKDCVALEDSPTGVRSATAAGCHVIAIPHIVEVPRSSRPSPGRLARRSHRRHVAGARPSTARLRCSPPGWSWSLSPASARLHCCAIQRDLPLHPTFPSTRGCRTSSFPMRRRRWRPTARCCIRSLRSGTRRRAPRRSPSTPTSPRTHRPSSSPRRAPPVRRSCLRSPTRCRPAGWPPCWPTLPSVLRTSPRSAISRQPTATTESTSTTSSSRSPTIDRHVGDHEAAVDRLHHRARQPPACRRPHACRSACRTSRTTAAPTTAATGCTTTAGMEPHVDQITDHGLRLLAPPRPARSPHCRSCSRRSTVPSRRSTTTTSWPWVSRCTDTTGRSLRLVHVQPSKRVRPA